MKLDAGRIDSHLKIPALPITLIFGPDAGLVAARGLALVNSIPGAKYDPFGFAELSDPTPSEFLAEATAASLAGGRRVVRVRDAGEALAKPLESLAQTGTDALIIVEAGELTAKSKLRTVAEKSAAIAAIACYAVDAAKLPQLITARLRAAGITIEPDAAAWAARNIPGEEGPLGQALELLTLYAGTQKTLTMADLTAALPDGGDTSINEAIDAVLIGDIPGADRALTLAYEEGTSPVGILRVLLTELSRLRLAASAMQSGLPALQAMSAMRPPVFFKRQQIVTRALSLWRVPALTSAITTALKAESACKQTLTPDQDFCRYTLLTLAASVGKQ